MSVAVLPDEEPLFDHFNRRSQWLKRGKALELGKRHYLA